MSHRDGGARDARSTYGRLVVALVVVFLSVPVVAMAASTYRERTLPRVTVVSFRQGQTSFRDAVSPSKSLPKTAVTRYDDSDDAFGTPGFVSLGLGGELVVELAGGVADKPGPDIVVVETTWSPQEGAERARVYASNDLRSWKSVGDVSNASAREESPHTEQKLDLAATGLQRCRYLKLVDATIPLDKKISDGFDVALIAALHR